MALQFLLASEARAAEVVPTSLASGLAVLLLGIVVGCAAALLALGLPARRRVRLYQQAWASLPNPRQLVNREGRVIYANPACARLLGGSDRPVPELLLALTSDEEARERITRLSANAANGTAGQAEVPVLSRSIGPNAAGVGGSSAALAAGAGSAMSRAEIEWLQVAVHPIRESPGTVFWQVDDITTRRQLEQVVHDEQASFVDLFDHAPIGFYSVDGDGRFLMANRTLAEWLGTQPDRLLDEDLRLHDLVAGPLPEEARPYDPIGADGAGAGDGAGTTGEVVLRSFDGSSFKALVSQDLMRDANGAVVRTRSVVRHLSHEREMADALAHSQRRFERFFEDAPVGIALLDGSGRITEYNRKMAAMAGYREALPEGATLEALVADASAAAIQAGLARCRESSGSSGPEEPIEVRMRADAEVSCALFMTPIGDKLSEDGDIIVHFIDTTERKRLELQFVQSQKMQAVGQLAGGIAHDFNNLLTAMIGFSDLLLLRHQPGDQSFADIMQIKQNAIRAGNLVRQLLAFSRQQTLQPKVLNVTDILAELSHLLRRLIGENIELRMIHGRDLGPVKADQVQLEQVIINLAVNARDAMTEGGTLTIQTDNEELARDAKRHGEVIPPGRYTRIRVFDTGCGIEPALLDRIFEPFFSTKEVGDGTGLGLSTVYGIVKQTGGFVYVDSVIGEGSTFTILLPHFTAETAEAGEAEATVERRQDLTGTGTVLLVEDEDAVRTFSARALRDKGYKVIEAPSGEAALEILRDGATVVDLLVTDVVMPRLDGPALVREVRGERPNMNVIFISGYTEDTFRRRLDREAGIHFLPKPFTLKQLAGKVKEVMHGEPEPV